MKRLTTEQFINKSNAIHGKKYEYGNCIYLRSIDKVSITCKLHGDFLQKPNGHLSGHGCPKCGGTDKLSTQSFINDSEKIHGNIYDYSKVNYINKHNKVSIICSIHGEFLQTPNNHLKNQGCPKCKGGVLINCDDFIKKSNIVHDGKYSYSLSIYKNNNTKVKIVCYNHGEFMQTPNSHLARKGCPKCKSSKGELQIISILKDNKIDFIHQKKFYGCKYKSDLIFDFFLPELNILIEYNGYQHYYPVDYFGGIVTFNNIKNRDGIKREYCLNNNIELIIIKYDENIYDKLNKKLNKDYVMW